LSKDFYSL